MIKVQETNVKSNSQQKKRVNTNNKIHIKIG